MNEPNFEQSLAALEKIVRDLETGEMPLEESLKLFETGVKLSRDCQTRLDDATRRVEILMRDDDGKPKIERLASEDLAETPERKPRKPIKRIVFDDDAENENAVF
ncbi:MAG: exodeoxyribonuclease VII small subunit [Pyrinomonadaceae bacterium]|nr:exodeoxyribonuclease VII small subunit [Pyrinomonadaceae bacterium]